MRDNPIVVPTAFWFAVNFVLLVCAVFVAHRANEVLKEMQVAVDILADINRHLRNKSVRDMAMQATRKPSEKNGAYDNMGNYGGT